MADENQGQQAAPAVPQVTNTPPPMEPPPAQDAPLEATITEFDPATGMDVSYDTKGNIVGSGQTHPAALPPQDPATSLGRQNQKPTPPAQATAPAQTPPPTQAQQNAALVGDDVVAAQEQAPAQTTAVQPPQQAQQAQQAPAATEQGAQQPDAQTPEQRALAVLQAENAALRAQVQQGAAPPEVKPDLSGEPDWTDADKYPTEEAASKAKTEWLQERYQAAATKAVQQQHAEQQRAAAEQQQRTIQAEVQQTHEAVRARMGLDQNAYAAEVAKLAAVTHPQWNEKFQVRNPVGVVLADTRKQALGELQAAGIDTSGYDTFNDLHEAQVRDNGLAQRIAALPISQETNAIVEAAARQPKTVAVMRHLTSPAGAADLQRLLRPGTAPAVIHGEVYRIAHALAVQNPVQETNAAAPQGQVDMGLAAMTPGVPVLPTPGRTSARPSKAVKPGLDTQEGIDAEFARQQAAADKSGANGWGSY